MEVHHDEAQKKFWVEVDGYKADMSYHLQEGHLDIRHTLVPEAIGGRGIASMLVKTAYDYARHKGLKPMATCAYAVRWLQRHPEYQGVISEDYAGSGTCAL